MLAAVSNKDFIGEATGLPLSDRTPPSIAAATICVLNGARILRMHDIAASVAAARMIEAVMGFRQPAYLHHNMSWRAGTKPCHRGQLLCSAWTSGRGNGCCPWPLTAPRSWQPQRLPERGRGSTSVPIPRVCGVVCRRTGSALPDNCRSRLTSGLHLQLPEPESPVQARVGPAPAMERWPGARRRAAAFRCGLVGRASRTKAQPEPASASRQPGELADPAAAAKRAAARAERVATGLDELDQWLCDQIRGGIAGLEEQAMPTSTPWLREWSMQAPGVAGMLRAIPAEFASVGWPSRVLEQLGALHLLVQAHRRLDQLPADLAATVRARIGYSVSKSEVLSLPGVVDHWFAVGMVDTAEYRLVTRRVWLYGAGSGRWAVIMSFGAPPGGPLDDTVMAGTCCTLGCISTQVRDSPGIAGRADQRDRWPDDAAGRILR